MILAVDVHYQNGTATVAAVVFDSWGTDQFENRYVSYIDQVEPYRPGQFYRRELPCILRILSEHGLAPDTIVIDGYVDLDGESRPGLGRYLYDALRHRVSIIGVAKKPFKDIGEQYRILRGCSKNPLYITAAGMPLAVAKKRILSMHGTHRIPTLLRLVDRYSRRHG